MSHSMTGNDKLETLPDALCCAKVRRQERERAVRALHSLKPCNECLNISHAIAKINDPEFK